MTVLRLDFAVLISVFIGITNIIPVFGPFIGAVPSIFILLLVNPIQALIFCILILIIQQFDGNFIGPKILGQSIGISALWVLFSIVVGGASPAWLSACRCLPRCTVWRRSSSTPRWTAEESMPRATLLPKKFLMKIMCLNKF